MEEIYAWFRTSMIQFEEKYYLKINVKEVYDISKQTILITQFWKKQLEQLKFQKFFLLIKGDEASNQIKEEINYFSNISDFQQFLYLLELKCQLKDKLTRIKGLIKQILKTPISENIIKTNYSFIKLQFINEILNYKCKNYTYCSIDRIIKKLINRFFANTQLKLNYREEQQMFILIEKQINYSCMTMEESFFDQLQSCQCSYHNINKDIYNFFLDLLISKSLVCKINKSDEKLTNLKSRQIFRLSDIQQKEQANQLESKTRSPSQFSNYNYFRSNSLSVNKKNDLPKKQENCKDIKIINEITQQNEYQCFHEHHQNEQIIGFCLNSTCALKSQFCFQCQSLHESHKPDCISFGKINEVIQGNKTTLSNLKERMQQMINNINKIHQDFKSFLKGEEEKLNQVEKYLMEKNYKLMVDNIQPIKQWNSFKNSAEQINQQPSLGKLLIYQGNTIMFEIIFMKQQIKLIILCKNQKDWMINYIYSILINQKCIMNLKIRLKLLITLIKY